MRNYIILGAVIVLIAAVIILFITRKELKQEGGKSKKKRFSKSTLELIPVRYYDRDYNCYVLSDGTMMDILQINTKDLISASQDEVEYDCLKLGKLFKTYAGDIKIVSLNFPCDTSSQQRYFREKLSNAKNEVYEYWLKVRLRELERIEKTHTTREFYFLFFSNSFEENEKNRNTFLITLAVGKDGLVSILPEEKKHQILTKMNNKNALVSSGGA
ncbi:MAG: hypothetical protein MJ116_10400 [Lachnospiraceae bacterium]|nr:hypothetical protein [Lachnospiraceae bacterium]